MALRWASQKPEPDGRRAGAWLLALVLVLGAGYLGWLQAVQGKPAPHGGQRDGRPPAEDPYPPARGGLLAGGVAQLSTEVSTAMFDLPTISTARC